MAKQSVTGDTGLITEIAVLYYLENQTQEQIANTLQLSRVKVGRLLKKAIDEGIVEIQVRNHPARHEQLEQELKRRFGIDRAMIAVDHSDPDMQRMLVADLAGAYLAKTVKDRMIVAVGMGRNVGSIAEGAVNAEPRNALFISAIGGSVRAGQHMNPDHISRRLAAKFGGQSETLYAPALVASNDLREALLLNDTVKQTLDTACRADIALIGIGDMSEDSNLVRMGWFSPQEITAARLSGTVGDMMGYDFLDIQGNPAAFELHGRVIGLSRPDLARIPDVLAVASENTKGAAILGALRSGVINTLCTTTTNAQTVLKLDDATAQEPEG
ncbi:sugar-binding transcriptional regulator [Aliamphritea hakodatensis]|uniref:sugar-binding transcriptional regulator n=1 Tax=Aliamphritea hakodatensis TaxID=2895352 RepID=UPI0022FD70B3|nr:sugar-binding transcriptional regulator [Aliamphritea hakodatensis]